MKTTLQDTPGKRWRRALPVTLLAASLLVLPSAAMTAAAAPGGGAVADLTVERPEGSGVWKSSSTLNVTRNKHSSAVDLQGRIYVIGGFRGGYDVVPMERYDPAVDTWQTLPGMLNTARHSHSSVVDAQGHIYAIGGSSGRALASVERYSPTTGTWETLPSALNTARYGHSSVIDDQGRIYAIGGFSTIYNTNLASVERYDPAVGTWQTLPGMLNTARRSQSSVVDAQGHIYAIGGSSGRALASVERYNPTTGTWETLPSVLNTARYGHSSVIDDQGRIYAIGGFYVNRALTSTEHYDLKSGVWEVLPGALTVPRRDHSSVIDSLGRIYVISGSNGPNNVNSVEVLEPSSSTATGRVLDSAGNPVPGATVSFDGRSGVSAMDGSVRVALDPAATSVTEAKVTGAPQGYQVAPDGTSVSWEGAPRPQATSSGVVHQPRLLTSTPFGATDAASWVAPAAAAAGTTIASATPSQVTLANGAVVPVTPTRVTPELRPVATLEGGVLSVSATTPAGLPATGGSLSVNGQSYDTLTARIPVAPAS